MKIENFVLGIMFGVMMLAGVPAYAESIQGTITAVNPDDKSVTISPSNAGTTGLPAEVNLKLEDEDAYKDKGINSLDELAVGDDVLVEADRKDDGSFDVKSFQRASETGMATGGAGTGASMEARTGEEAGAGTAAAGAARGKARQGSAY